MVCYRYESYISKKINDCQDSSEITYFMDIVNVLFDEMCSTCSVIDIVGF